AAAGRSSYWPPLVISTKTIRASLLASATAVSLNLYLTVLRSSIPLAQRRRARAVQRSQLSPICNSFQVLDATGVADDSAGRKSLNLCEATESMGGRLEVLEVLGAVS